MSKNTPKEHADTAGSDSEDEDVFHDARFPAEEEAQLLEESHSIKAEANKLFTAACYDQAISCYDRALASCPNYLDYEVAVLRSNMAACYLKLEDWKASVDSATACLDCLEKVIPSANENPDAPQEKQQESGSTDSVVEITGDDEEAEQEELKRLQKVDDRKNDVMRIRAKALMRRARAKSQLSGWGNLQGAEEDYKLLASMDNLPPDDRRVVQKALRELPDKIAKARENEMAEMMGKLKDLGNGILKPFGLSTDNFKFTQDPKTGGYSMNFQS
ncbi:tetratricopeptide repeat protein 1 (TTC1) [Aspergillus nomiae NRRL 13137]|uniref:Tetratricopeptide repeat protein 1 (TTC1) n=1 Tax=Aspergillus nomiae NRRL (strain ATCC 15546 / NRRL 13137 / CBS 260.88 / M93) TaxID=1509407 RepID=A0A0L1IZP3_ASPN3|nr:tetratricopeptide repeat protein 1 (TTC1) [Aspergillus nomiae NRRL 13137]KNG84947.1 tetratricopeptide repeat protein 1 (TTC1) [Aspergillus nomiae NRRL 13137]